MPRKANQRVVILGEGLGVLNDVVAGVSHGPSDGGHVASAFLARHSRSNLSLPQHPPPSAAAVAARPTMSVSLNPSNALGFKRASRRDKKLNELTPLQGRLPPLSSAR